MRYNGKCKVANLLGFNSNIRCIEIEYNPVIRIDEVESLIVTLDVLKCGVLYAKKLPAGKFNSNIRCIEMYRLRR